MKHLLITGAGRGIGRHLLETFAPTVERVAIFDIDEVGGREAQNMFPNATFYSCDVADAEAVNATVEASYSDGFDFDGIINNAGIIHSAPLINLLAREDRTHSVSDWNKVIATNLNSVFYITSQIVDRMIRNRVKGTIINISSISAKGNPGQSAYSAAKAGVDALTKTWAKELGPMGLRFISIAPGFIDTPSTAGALTPDRLAKITSQVPLRRLGSLDHLSHTVQFAFENDYVNGTILEVDGGLVI